MRLGAMSFNPAIKEAYTELGMTAAKIVFNFEEGRTHPLSSQLGNLKPVADIRCHPSLVAEPTFVALFARFAARCARDSEECSEFAIWEEANCPITLPGSNATTYARLLKATYEAIKEVRPDALVYNGGMGVHGDVWQFERLAEAGALDYLDAINLHPFCFAPHFFDFIATYERLFKSLGAYGKPFVITEFGIPSGIVASKYPSLLTRHGVFAPSEHGQAERLKWCMDKFELEGVGLCCLIVQDIAAYGQVKHWSHVSGLIRKDGSHKPAYVMLERRRSQ